MSISFQEIILRLQKYWADYGCLILQPYDLEMGAGTFHPATVLRGLSDQNWNVAFVQPCRRPIDSRYGMHPNRLQHYYQFQVILKPIPENFQYLYLNSLKELGINYQEHDIRFLEDDWASPTLGASGLGWEISLNGLEVSQFTYMQQIASIPSVAGEVTYGLERLALYIQGCNKIADIDWNGKGVKYQDVEFEAERQFSSFNTKYADVKQLKKMFADCQEQVQHFVENNLPLVAYEYCIKASHIFNLLDARGVIHVNAREMEIAKIRNLARLSCESWLKFCNNKDNQVG